MSIDIYKAVMILEDQLATHIEKIDEYYYIDCGAGNVYPHTEEEVIDLAIHYGR